MTVDPTPHFLTGMPNSGTTLLRALLDQRDDTIALPTDDFADAYGALRDYWSNSHEEGNRRRIYGAEESARFRLQTFRNLIDSRIFKPGNPYSHIFLKDWQWLIHHEALRATHPQSLVVFMMRHPMASLTSILSREAKTPEVVAPRSPQADSRERFTERVGRIFAPPVCVGGRLERGGQLGLPLTWAEEILGRGARNFENVRFVRYEDLCTDPGRVLAELYAAARMPAFDGHNFDEVQPPRLLEVDEHYRGNVTHAFETGPVRARSNWRQTIPYQIAEQVKNKYPLVHKEFGYA